MSNDSILEELIAENTYLRNQVSSSKDVTLSYVETQTLSNFRIDQELKNKIKISGILLAEGMWNGVLYTKDELKKMYERFKDKLAKLPLKVEHEKTDEFKDKDVGKHTRVEWSDTLGAILYEAEVVDPKAVELVKDGTFPATSMKTRLRKISDGTLVKGVDYEPIDNSLTTNPACKACVIVSKETLSEGEDNTPVYKYYGIIKETVINNENDKELKEERKEVSDEYFELSTPKVAVLPEDEQDGEVEEVELEFMDLAEALKRKRVIYEYYQPGKYPSTKKRVKRKKGYYYYPVPHYYYYPYYPYYYPYYEKSDDTEGSGPRTERERLIAHFGEEKAKKLLELVGEDAYKLLPPRGSASEDSMGTVPIIEMSEEDLAGLPENPKKGDLAYKKVRNKYVVFQATGKKGFGMWKIVAQFDTEDEAKDYISKGGKTEETKSQGVIIPIGTDHPETIEEGKEEKVKCPVCGKEFDTKEEMIEHFNKEHSEEYGKYEEGKYPEKKEEKKKEDNLEDNDLSEDTEELRRKRCVFCNELVDDLEEHYKECEMYKETLEEVFRCKFCGKVFKSRKDLLAHLPSCKKYAKYKKAKLAELSEEGSDDTESPGVNEDKPAEEDEAPKPDANENEEESPSEERSEDGNKPAQSEPERKEQSAPPKEELIEKAKQDHDFLADLIIATRTRRDF